MIRIGKLNDIALVTQVVVMHDNRAFDHLMKKYQSDIRRFFLNLTCGDKPLSDDLAQDTFLKAYLALNSFHGMSSFSTWLYRIAYNVYYDYLRSQKNLEDIDLVAGEEELRVQQKDLEKEMDIYQALSVLRDAERSCITLFYMEDQSIEKIVKITGYPMGTVKSYLKRAKEKMAKYLEENGYDRRR